MQLAQDRTQQSMRGSERRGLPQTTGPAEWAHRVQLVIEDEQPDVQLLDVNGACSVGEWRHDSFTQQFTEARYTSSAAAPLTASRPLPSLSTSHSLKAFCASLSTSWLRESLTMAPCMAAAGVL